jgi:hypothetical protein
MISLLLLIPVLGSLVLIPIREDSIKSQSLMKNIALITSLINFLVSIFMWIEFDSSTTQYQFVYEFNQISFYQFNVGVDGISLYFVLLTTFVTPIAILSDYTSINKNIKYFLISFLMLETLQIFAFVSLDLLLFYIFFESILPIIFIVIVIYGHGENRFRSAFLLFLYTLAGSLPMLLSILYIYSYIGSTDFQLISLSEISFEIQKLLWLGFFIAFAVKTPLYPFTLWLPKAHSDSPLAGSILLAGTILKLATYGYIRVLINFLPDASNYFEPLIQTIAIIAIIYASLATIIQQDTKRLIAYSSIAHIYPNGPLNIFYLLSQTICGKPNGAAKPRCAAPHPFYLGTHNIFYRASPFALGVKILNNYLGNPQITKTCYKQFNLLKFKLFIILVGISETTRLLFTNIIIIFNSSTFFKVNFPILTACAPSPKTISDSNYNSENKNKESDKHFYEWLAGLIDGNGYFWTRKINRVTSLVITFDIRDMKTAQIIKDHLGGNLNLLSGNKAVIFKLHKYDAIVSLVNNINGLIRTQNRIEQLKLVCLNYGIEYKDPIKLEFNNAWFSGFFDADGHVSYNKSHGSVNLCITQKNENLLLELASIYNGKVYNHSKNSNNYRFIISNKSSVLTILNDYFIKYPSRSMKQNRLMLIKKYYDLRIMNCHLAPKGSLLHKAWVEFNQNWLNYNYY